MMNINGLLELNEDLKARGFDAHLNTLCTRLLVQLEEGADEAMDTVEVARLIFASIGRKVEVLNFIPQDGIFMVQPE